MSLDTGAVVGIAVAAAFAGFLLAIIALYALYVAGRYMGLAGPTKKADEEEAGKEEAGKEEVGKDEAGKDETKRGPVVREKNTEAHRKRKEWMEEYDEYNLIKEEDYADQFKEKFWLNYRGSVDVLNFDRPFCIPRRDLPASLGLTTGEGNDPAPHDISAALSHYFDGQLELGIDHRIIAKLLFHADRTKRLIAVEFLINKAGLSFCNWGSDPKYSILPPEMLILGEELRVRGPKSLSDYQARLFNWRNPHPFEILYSRWRVLTQAMWGTQGIPPAAQISIDRRVDFLMTVLSPIMNPDTLVPARKSLVEMMEASYDLAFYCISRHNLILTNWDFTDQTQDRVLETCEKTEPIPPFDMMAEKTLVLCPAWVVVASPWTAMPFKRANAMEPADLIKFTDTEWEELTKDL